MRVASNPTYQMGFQHDHMIEAECSRGVMVIKSSRGLLSSLFPTLPSHISTRP